MSRRFPCWFLIVVVNIPHSKGFVKSGGENVFEAEMLALPGSDTVSVSIAIPATKPVSTTRLVENPVCLSAIAQLSLWHYNNF